MTWKPVRGNRSRMSSSMEVEPPTPPSSPIFKNEPIQLPTPPAPPSTPILKNEPTEPTSIHPVPNLINLSPDPPLPPPAFTQLLENTLHLPSPCLIESLLTKTGKWVHKAPQKLALQTFLTLPGYPETQRRILVLIIPANVQMMLTANRMVQTPEEDIFIVEKTCVHREPVSIQTIKVRMECYIVTPYNQNFKLPMLGVALPRPFANRRVFYLSMPGDTNITISLLPASAVQSQNVGSKFKIFFVKTNLIFVEKIKIS